MSTDPCTSPSVEEIAQSFKLWQQFVDPSGFYSEESFNSMPMFERLEFIKACFPDK